MSRGPLPEDTAPVARVEVLSTLPGKAHGLSQPALVARVTISAHGQADWDAVDTLFRAALADHRGPFVHRPSGLSPLWERVLGWAAGLQRFAAIPVLEDGFILQSEERGPTATATLAVPHAPFRPTSATDALRWAAECAARVLAGGDGIEPEELVRSVETAAAALAPAALAGSNMLHFLTAAKQQKVPWDLLARNSFQLGWGARSRWLDSSFTDRTPMIGGLLSRDKAAAAKLLRRIGLPVPDHRVAASADDAVSVAERFGYPVVIKPVDQDGGIGVAVGLKAADDVRDAWSAAREHSRRVMVQRQVEGQDYRIVVFEGRVIWAVLREPGGVTGDGENDVTSLVHRLNAHPSRGGRLAPLKTLIIDDEARALLAEQGMTEASIPAEGAFIRLRGAANMASGGIPSVVMGKIHPDNAAFAEEAARAFRLDIAGIDLLLPDIARSWHETGGWIIEVNGQPQLGYLTQQHLYGDILAHILGGDGRIPVALIIGGAEAGEVARRIEKEWMERGLCVGVATESGAWIGGKRAGSARAGLFAATQLVLSSERVEMALVVAGSGDALRAGTPVDRFDTMVLASGLTGDDMSRILETFAPNVAGAVIINGMDPACAAAGPTPGGPRREVVEGVEAMAAAANRWLSQQRTPAGANESRAI